MRAGDAAVGMDLVDNDVAKFRPEGGPGIMVAQEREVEHFRVGNQNAGRLGPQFLALIAGGVAVDNRGCRPQRLRDDAAEIVKGAQAGPGPGP